MPIATFSDKTSFETRRKSFILKQFRHSRKGGSCTNCFTFSICSVQFEKRNGVEYPLLAMYFPWGVEKDFLKRVGSQIYSLSSRLYIPCFFTCCVGMIDVFLLYFVLVSTVRQLACLIPFFGTYSWVKWGKDCPMQCSQLSLSSTSV